MNTLNSKLKPIADELYTLIAKSVNSGAYVREYADEQPTYERIKASLPYGLVRWISPAEVDAIAQNLYGRLRKNGILAKMRRT